MVFPFPSHFSPVSSRVCNCHISISLQLKAPQFWGSNSSALHSLAPSSFPPYIRWKSKLGLPKMTGNLFSVSFSWVNKGWHNYRLTGGGERSYTTHVKSHLILPLMASYILHAQHLAFQVFLFPTAV